MTTTTRPRLDDFTPVPWRDWGAIGDACEAEAYRAARYLFAGYDDEARERARIHEQRFQHRMDMADAYHAAHAALAGSA